MPGSNSYRLMTGFLSVLALVLKTAPCDFSSGEGGTAHCQWNIPPLSAHENRLLAVWIGCGRKAEMQGKIWNSGTQERERKNGDSPHRRRTDWATVLKIVELCAACKTGVPLSHQAGENGPWFEWIACLSSQLEGRFILQSAQEILFFGNA